MSTIIAFTTNKGGVAKTTSTHNVGAALAEAGYKILLVDLDPQCSLTLLCTDVNAIGKHVGIFMLGKATFEEIVIHLPQYDLLPATEDLIGYEDIIKSSASFPFNLKQALSKSKLDYDYILLDCPPAKGGLTKVGLIACDWYFIPMLAEHLSYEGLRTFIAFANETHEISGKTNFGGVFATRYNPNIRKRVAHQLIQATRDQLGAGMLQTSIRENVRISDGQAFQQDVIQYDPQSNGAEDYRTLTAEILEVIKK